jgi:threonine/homoserine/homoserine lactone efflux protein
MVTILGIGSALAVGAMSPGPSFLMVARTAVASSRMNGLSAALGMGVGATVFAIAALFGLQAVLAAVPWLYLALKLVGGTYLVYLGYRIWKGARTPLALSVDGKSNHANTLLRSFLLGLGTQISNPKTAIVYGSIFASLLPQEIPVTLIIAIPIVVFMIEAGWYSVVAVLLSSTSPRDTYLRYKSWIDRVVGSVMGLLGVRLVFNAAKP